MTLGVGRLESVRVVVAGLMKTVAVQVLLPFLFSSPVGTGAFNVVAELQAGAAKVR